MRFMVTHLDEHGLGAESLGDESIQREMWVNLNAPMPGVVLGSIVEVVDGKVRLTDTGTYDEVELAAAAEEGRRLATVLMVE